MQVGSRLPNISFIHPEDQAATLSEIEKLTTGIPTLYFENRYRCKDGSFKWMAWTAFPVVEEGLIYAIARDMTERQMAEEMLKASVIQLEKLNRLKDDFLDTVSHELRSPLASIKMATSMLELIRHKAGGLASESNRAAQYLQILHDECERGSSLIDDLLDLSRLDADAIPLNLTTIELPTWIPQIVEPFTKRAHNQQQSLLVDIPAALPPLTTDLSVLGRILAELLHNACKYTNASEQILITAAVFSGRLRLQVSNSGVEIPDSELERIFDKFYRIPNNNPWKHSGTGLGLALVKKLVEHLGGNILATASNRWITFTIELSISPTQ